MLKSTASRWAMMGIAVTAALVVMAGAAWSADGPRVVYPETRFVFSGVIEGNPVVHAFVVQNHGDATLDIKNVRTGWGCTVVSFQRQIPPGGEGTIKVRINTERHGGQPLHKTVMVITNDKTHPRQELVVTGRVESLADMSASEIDLDGKAGTPIRREITIRETKKYPFSVTGIGARDGRFITYRIRPVPNTHPKVLVLTVVNRKSTPGRFFDTIYIQTDSKAKTRISVPVIGNIH